MATQTPNLNLTKPMGTDYVRVGDFNDNADKLDVSIGDLGQLTTDAKASLVLAINEAALRGGENAPFIDVDTLHWMMWDVATAQYVDSGVKAEGADGSDGADGISAFVWIKWSAIQPTQNSDMKDTPDQFIGVYSGTSPTAPTAYTSYQWYKYKGEKGDTGDPGTGNNWYTGNAITGTSTTPTAYATGIDTAQVGDHYLNNGALPNTGRDYICTQAGDPSTALWKYNALLRGADGNGIGDMLKSVYDADNNGIVDKAESVIDGAISTAKLENNAVTNAKQAQMAAYTLKGNNTNASADPQDITASNVRSMIDAQETMQYTAMPETVTNGTIIQYIGETTIVAPIYTNGHFYKGVDGVWVEIVYGDPNSVSYDAQSGKTAAQKEQARVNIGAAAGDVFSRNGDVAVPSGYKGIDVRPFSTGVSIGIGKTAPETVNSVDLDDDLAAALREAIGAVPTGGGASVRTLTLPASGWTSGNDGKFYQNLSVSNLPASGVFYHVSPTPSSIDEYAGYGVRMLDVTTANTANFKADIKPTSTLTVYISTFEEA